MIVLTASNISKYYGASPVLRGVSFTAEENSRMGFVGVNGAGKTTLFNILAGEDAADEGRVSVSSLCSLGYLKQNNSDVGGLSVLETLNLALSPVVGMEQRLREMEHEMASAHEDDAAFRRLSHEYDELTRRYEAAGGYDRESRVQGVLAGLGFTRGQQEQQANTLSGGERTRLKLAELLLRRPDILLLDEPTNHLDLESTQWLEETLKSYKGTVLIISHDRYLLDAVCTQVAELSLTHLKVYDGNYTLYSRKAAKMREDYEKAYYLQQREIERQEAIIARYRMYNTEQSIKKAESREKMLARMERIEKPRSEATFNLSFKAGHESGRDVLMAENISKGFDAGPLFSGVDLLVRSGERVALIGPNGAGKTTLISVLAGRLAPDSGFVRKGSGVDLGFFDQQHAELDLKNRVIDELWNAYPRMNETQVRSALGSFLFRGDDAFQHISTLSGGERARLTLLKLMLRGHNLLIMDEPTNHLDMASRELLEKALEGFDGTLIAISHDRYFINRVADRVLVFTGGSLEDYPGNYDAYLLSRRKPLEDDEGSGLSKTRIVKDKKRERELRERGRRRKQEIAEAEKEIAKAEERQRELEERMASPGFYAGDGAGGLAAEYSRIPELLEKLYERWAELESEDSAQ